MRSYSALLAAFLILLLAAPVAPLAAGTPPSAGPGRASRNLQRSPGRACGIRQREPMMLSPRSTTMRFWPTIITTRSSLRIPGCGLTNTTSSTLRTRMGGWHGEAPARRSPTWMSRMPMVRFSTCPRLCQTGLGKQRQRAHVTEGDETLWGADLDYYSYGYAYSVALDDLTVWTGVSNGSCRRVSRSR